MFSQFAICICSNSNQFVHIHNATIHIFFANATLFTYFVECNDWYSASSMRIFTKPVESLPATPKWWSFSTCLVPLKEKSIFPLVLYIICECYMRATQVSKVAHKRPTEFLLRFGDCGGPELLNGCRFGSVRFAMGESKLVRFRRIDIRCLEEWDFH